MGSQSMISSSTSSVSSAALFAEEGSLARGEVEVAQVLASLGRTYSVESSGGVGGGGGESGGWGSKGKRSSSKRVKDDGDIVVEQNCSLPLPFDLNMDQAALYEDCENEDQPSVAVKVEVDCEPAEPCSLGSVMQNGGRSRQNLSEAEKEARRIRRILANRESARQTIRRRQALYEELTRRSAELATENEDLKRRKDLAAREFQTLQSTNHNLKNKITRITGLELGKNGEVELASRVGESIDSSNKFLSNSLIFPAYVQTSDSDVSRQPSLSGLRFRSEMMVSPNVNPVLLNAEENTSSSSSQHLPWCILPCPWFVALPDTGKTVNQSGSSNRVVDKDEESLLQARHVCSPSSVIPCLRDCLSSGDPGRVQQLVFRADSASCGPSPLCSSRNVFSLKHEVCEGCVSPHPPTKAGALSATGVRPSGVAPDCGKQSVESDKKKMEAAAGADARKRRRELIKLKSLHYESASKRRCG